MLGYIHKVKKILESVCFNCSKLKVCLFFVFFNGNFQVDTSNDKFNQARRIKDRKRRFQLVWELCKGKTICQEDDADKKSTHGGCGQRQPLYRKEGFKITANFKSYKDDVYSY